jgi:hypothetical protein
VTYRNSHRVQIQIHSFIITTINEAIGVSLLTASGGASRDILLSGFCNSFRFWCCISGWQLYGVASYVRHEYLWSWFKGFLCVRLCMSRDLSKSGPVQHLCRRREVINKTWRQIPSRCQSEARTLVHCPTLTARTLFGALFIYGLFNEAFNSSCYTPSNDKVIGEWWIVKSVWTEAVVANWNYQGVILDFPAFSWRTRGKPHKHTHTRKKIC